ncbi:MAG: hypothetical protein ACPG4F_07950 [Paracoccaceae bacterium]
MENLKLPIALVVAMVLQISGGVWWVSQQATTINRLNETVSELGSRMAIEENVNLRRDVAANKMELIEVWDEVEMVWEDMGSFSAIVNRQIEILGRISTLEREMQIFSQQVLNGPGYGQ